jgi:hypothetical protein
LTGFPITPPGAATTALVREINAIGNSFRKINAANPGLQCRHEFFFYESAHGNPKGFALYDTQGLGKTQFIWYGLLVGYIIKAMPTNTTIYAMAASCMSGGLMVNGGWNRVSDAKFFSYFTMSATDVHSYARPRVSNPTQNFVSGLSKDLDKDGFTEDLGDAVKNMLSGWIGNPRACYWNRVNMLNNSYYNLEKFPFAGGININPNATGACYQTP